MSAPTEEEKIMADKKASDVYDRQIRLWGADAQAKMAQTRVLYIHITGVTSEVLKNLVLAGIRPALYDPRPYNQVAATTPSLFYTKANEHPKKIKYSDDLTVMKAIQPAVEELNPLLGACECIADWKAVVADFHVIVASGLSKADMLYLAEHKQATAQLLVVDTFGLYGAALLDWGKGLQYRPEKGKELLDPVSLTPYIPLKDMLAVPLSKAVNRFHKQIPPPAYWRYRCRLEYHTVTGQWPTAETKDLDQVLKDYLAGESDYVRETVLGQLDSVGRMAEIAPVCAVLGGLIGNEVIKVISGKGQPANNTVLFDGSTCKAFTFLVQSKEK